MNNKLDYNQRKDIKYEHWNCNLKVETFYVANFCFDR